MSVRSILVNIIANPGPYVAGVGTAHAATTRLAAAEATLATRQAATTAAFAGSGRAARVAAGGMSAAQRSMAGAAGSLATLNPALLGGAGLVLGLKSAFAASVNFEQQFAMVRKVMDESDDVMDGVASSIRRLATDMPVTTEALNQIAAGAGRMGVAAGDIEGFTRTVAMLNVAIEDMDPESIAMSFARIATITNTPIENIGELGSVVVRLGNNFAATEGEITNFALRIAGAGTQIGMTNDQILALSTALPAMGLRAEMGGSSVSRILIDMAQAVDEGGAKLEEFARVAGMSSQQFQTAFGQDAASALLTFLEGLSDAGAQGESTFAIIEELGLQNIRTRDTLLRGSTAADEYGRALGLASEEMRNLTALEDEYNTLAGTTASQWQILKNNISETARTVGDELKPALDFVIADLNAMFEGVRDGTGPIGFLGDAFTALHRPITDTSGYLDDWGIALGVMDSRAERFAFTAGKSEEATRRFTGSIADGGPPADELRARIEALGGTFEGSAADMDGATAAARASAAAFAAFGTEIAGLDIASESMVEGFQNVAQEMLSAGGAVERAREENRASAERAAEAHNKAIDRQIKALGRGKEAQKDALRSQKKEWEDFANDISVVQVTKHLEEINQEFRDWQSDVQTIAQRAGGDVAERLAMMGPEWAPIVAAAVDATAAELAALDAAMVDNLSLQAAAAEMAVQMRIMEEIALQGAGATVQSVADALGAGADVVQRIWDALELSPVEVDADIDPLLREFAEAQGIAYEFDRFVAIATADAEIDDAQRKFLEAHGLAHEWDEWAAEASFNADIAPVLESFFTAKGLGDEWAAFVAEAQVRADAEAALEAIDQAWIKGDAWGRAEFQSIIDGDNVPATSAISEAQAVGDSWDRSTFTASVRADTSQAQAALARLRASVAGLNASIVSARGTTANLVVPQAMGGVVDYFANGAENHVAQIAPAGAWRVWAEPETGGEAYIPLAASKRDRSREIWAETGRRLGIADFYAPGGFSGLPFDSGLTGSLMASALGGSSGDLSTTISRIEALLARWERLVADERQAERRADLQSRIREAEADVRAAENADERKRATEQLSDARKALADHDRDAARAAEQAAVADQLATLQAELRIAANREQWEFDLLSTSDQIANLTARIGAEQRYTDEWMRLWSQRQQLISAQTAALQQATAQATAQAISLYDQELAALNRLLDEAQRIQGQLAAAERRHAEQTEAAKARAAQQSAQAATSSSSAVAAAEKRAADAIRDVIRAREEQLRQQMRLEFADEGFSLRADQLAGQLEAQVRDIEEWQAGLAKLREMGVSQEVIDLRGLDAGPEALEQVRALLDAHHDHIAWLNESAAARNKALADIVAAEQRDSTSQLSRDIADIEREKQQELSRIRSDAASAQTAQAEDLADELARIDEEYADEKRRLEEELAAVGLDTGRGWADAIAEGIASGLPGIIAQVEAVKEAMRALKEAEAAEQAATAGSASAVAGLRASIGLPDDPISDQIWEDRIRAGAADMAEVERRLREKKQLGLYDSGGIWPSGTVGVNLSGRDEYVLTQPQMAAVAAGPSPVNISLHLDARGATVESVPHIEAALDAWSHKLGAQFAQRTGR